MSEERRSAAAVLRGPRPGRPPGRPPGTSARALELIALRLFAEQGFDRTTVEQIAAAAGVSRRTFFRYYDSKTSVLWSEFDREVTRLREVLETMPGELPVMAAVRRAVVMVNHYRAADVPELRTRMRVIGSAPELAASAAVHYDAWERAISGFAARRSAGRRSRCTRWRSAAPHWPPAGPRSTGGRPAPTPIWSSTSTRR